jgi:Flp pilus assembly protein TadG
MLAPRQHDTRAHDRGRDVSQEAAAAVEFAIVLPFVVFIVAAFVSVASFIIQYEHLNAGARESARYAALSQSTTADISARALDTFPTAGFVSVPVVEVHRQVAGATAWEGPLAATARPCNQTQVGESRVRVRLTGDVRSDVPVLSLVTLQMSAQGVYRCE